MAKVKITGHASGSGVITVTAPNTSTDRTITLPDSTGTILDNTSTLDATKLSGNLPAISAASLTNVPKDVTVGGRKNIVMNGAFQVWQRGTSFTADADAFGADRWAITRPNQTVTKEIASIGNIRCNSMKMLKTGGGAITGYYSIEDGTGVSAGGSLFNGKTLTLSYYARASGSFDNNGQVWLYYNNKSTSVQVATCTDSLSTSWTKFTHTFTMPTNTQTYANVYSLTLSLIRALDGNVGNSDWVEVAQVQLEESPVATDFEHRSYGEELALCQRYYQRITQSAGDFYIMASKGQSSDTTRFAQTLAVPLRASPTISQGGGFSGWRCFRGTSGVLSSTSTPATLGFVENAGFVSLQVAGFSGLTDNYFYGTSPSFTSSGYFDMDSEL